MVEQEKFEIVFEADTTGSIAPCQLIVRKHIESALTTLFKEIPGLRVGVGFNGDYCDHKSTYATKWHDLSKDIHSLVQFVRSTPTTNGGDLPECYEKVLFDAQGLDWSHKAKKALVIFADDMPHHVGYSENILNLDWRKETKKLAEMGVVIYAVQCLSKSYANQFYADLARITGGYHLRLDQFSEVMDLLMAICYQQAGSEKLANWEEEIWRKKRMSRTLDESFSTLSGKKRVPRFGAEIKGGLVPVPPGRFQILEVEDDIPIREFVGSNGLIFGTGKGFYEFTKSELIQEKKEVVLRDKATGDMFTGAKSREMIGLPMGVRGRVRPTAFEKYDVFVQSTSYTRNLKGGTRFLYEVDLSR